MTEAAQALDEIENAIEALADLPSEFSIGLTRREQRVARLARASSSQRAAGAAGGKREAERGLKPLEWQPIETAPKDGTAILIYHQNAYTQAVAAPVIDGWFVPRGGPVKNPTHWQPLPTPPANQEAET